MTEDKGLDDRLAELQNALPYYGECAQGMPVGA